MSHLADDAESAGTEAAVTDSADARREPSGTSVDHVPLAYGQIYRTAWWFGVALAVGLLCYSTGGLLFMLHNTAMVAGPKPAVADLATALTAAGPLGAAAAIIGFILMLTRRHGEWWIIVGMGVGLAAEVKMIIEGFQFTFPVYDVLDAMFFFSRTGWVLLLLSPSVLFGVLAWRHGPGQRSGVGSLEADRHPA